MLLKSPSFCTVRHTHTLSHTHKCSHTDVQNYFTNLSFNYFSNKTKPGLKYGKSVPERNGKWKQVFKDGTSGCFHSTFYHCRYKSFIAKHWWEHVDLMKYMHPNRGYTRHSDFRSLCFQRCCLCCCFSPLQNIMGEPIWIWKQMQMIFGTCWHLQRFNHLYFCFKRWMWNIEMWSAVSANKSERI